MKIDKIILVGIKGEDKYKNWLLPPDTWTIIEKIWFENEEIKYYRKTKRYGLKVEK